MTTSTAGIVSRSIIVNFQRPGFHCYPDAPEEVAYLRQRHRHLFRYTVEIEVHHNERDIEYHMFLNWLESLYGPGGLESGDRSCETLASELLARITAVYPHRWAEVMVSEDGECASRVRFTPVSDHVG